VSKILPFLEINNLFAIIIFAGSPKIPTFAK
jgi:hypothetical protein